MSEKTLLQITGFLLGIIGWVTLFVISWKIAVALSLILWANNINGLINYSGRYE